MCHGLLAASYRVRRSDKPAGSYETLAEVTGAGYRDVPRPGAYHYVITSRNRHGESVPSAEVACTLKRSSSAR